ncbi:MAG: hypothetical protein LBQ66_04650 [Planctomycetaceae bacterium]|nr:hypothetical protein [Planctomycetaceae bacterium]
MRSLYYLRILLDNIQIRRENVPTILNKGDRKHHNNVTHTGGGKHRPYVTEIPNITH